MTDANPKCEHCDRPLVWIGIGPGAEAVRACKCVDGPACTTCGSRRTEPFASYWHGDGTFHCIPYGHVFTP